MTGEPKPPRNRDQQQPPRKGETIESTVPEGEGPKRERSGPLPEEETYEREGPDRRSDGIQ
jgi:hypothetical protein